MPAPENVETVETVEDLIAAAQAEEDRLLVPLHADQLEVTVSASSRCRFGDFEAIMFEAAHGRTNRILVSLEPVLPSDESFTARSHEILDE